MINFCLYFKYHEVILKTWFHGEIWIQRTSGYRTLALKHTFSHWSIQSRIEAYILALKHTLSEARQRHVHFTVKWQTGWSSYPGGKTASYQSQVNHNYHKTRLLGHPQPQMYPPVPLNQYTLVNRTHKHYIYIYASGGRDSIIRLGPSSFTYTLHLIIIYMSNIEAIW